MKCFICGEEVPLDFTQKVAWTSQGESVCCAIHSEEEIRNFLLRDIDCPYYRLIGENFEGKKYGYCYGIKDVPYVHCQGNLMSCYYNYNYKY